MICIPCGDGEHDDCKNNAHDRSELNHGESLNTWCDCQHWPSPRWTELFKRFALGLEKLGEHKRLEARTE